MARRSRRSTSTAYLRASAAYLARSESTSCSIPVPLGIVARLECRELRSQTGHPGGVLEDNHRTEHVLPVDDGDRGDGRLALASVGELIVDLFRPQRRGLPDALAHLLQHAAAERGNVKRPEQLPERLVLGNSQQPLRGQ